MFKPGDLVERFIPPPDGYTRYGLVGSTYTVHMMNGHSLQLKELKNYEGTHYLNCTASCFRHASKDYDPKQQPYEDSDI